MKLGKVATQLCLTLVVKELKISVEHGRVVTTLNIIIYVVMNNIIYVATPFGFIVRYTTLVELK